MNARSSWASHAASSSSRSRPVPTTTTARSRDGGRGGEARRRRRCARRPSGARISCSRSCSATIVRTCCRRRQGAIDRSCPIVGPSIRSRTSASGRRSRTRGTGKPCERACTITSSSRIGSPPALNRRSTRPSPRSYTDDARPSERSFTTRGASATPRRRRVPPGSGGSARAGREAQVPLHARVTARRPAGRPRRRCAGRRRATSSARIVSSRLMCAGRR